MRAHPPETVNSPSTRRTFYLARAVAAGHDAGLPGVRPFAPVLQRLRHDHGVSGEVPPPAPGNTVQDVLRTPGRPLEETVRAEMEQRLAADFSDVRVHTDTAAHTSAQHLDAHAYTSGSHIVFQRGRYDGASAAGKQMLAHELTHVIQQRQGAVSGSPAGDGYAISDPMDSFEIAAEAGARRAMARPSRAAQADEPPASCPVPARPGSAGTPVAGTIPVQRTTADKDGNLQSYSSLSTSSKVKSAATAVRKIIEWWADGSTSPVIQYKSINDLVLQARTHVAKPPTAFIAWLDMAGLDALAAYPGHSKVTFSAQTLADLANRRAVLVSAAVTALGPNPHLHVPTHDPNYHTPANAHQTPLERTGRAGGEWVRTKATAPGLRGQTTGTVNEHLTKGLIADGNWQQVADIHVQICPGCGNSQDVDAFEVDHQQALSDIRDSLWRLADAMSYDPNLYATVQRVTPDFAKFFTTTPPAPQAVPGPPAPAANPLVEPTHAALHVFSNDPENVMRICRICNGASGKSADDILAWYRDNQFFGPEFLAQNVPTVATGDLLMRTRHGTGWGKAALLWFQTHHFPILKQVFSTARLGRLVTTRLAGQSQATTRATFEPNPAKKRKYQEEASTLSGINQAMGGSTAVLADYLERGPTEFAPGSPERFVKEFGDQIDERERRKRSEETEATDLFTEGWIAGRDGSPIDPSRFASRQEMARYRAGYLKGRDERREQYEQGYADGMQNPHHGAAPFATNAYQSGFQHAVDRRTVARRIGYEDGSTSTPPDPTRIPEGIEGETVLLRDYLAGYSKGMLDKANAQQPAPQGKGPGQQGV